MKPWALSLTLLLFTAVLVLNGSSCTAQEQPGDGAEAQAQQAQSSATAKIGPAFAPAGSAAASSARPVIQPLLAHGTTLLAEFSGTLNAKKLKPGAKVKAVLVQDIVVRGKVVAKSESKLVGHVTEVKLRDAQDPESTLGVVFDKILLKHHRELEMEAVVQALAPPVVRRSRVDEPDQMMPPPMLSPVANTGSNGAGRGTSSASSGGRTASGTTTLASSVTDLGTVTTVQSTPGSNPGNSVSRVRAAAASSQPMTGGAGVHGVYGLKNLSLKASTSDSNFGSVIVSTKSNIKLESGTQVVLLVVNK